MSDSGEATPSYDGAAGGRQEPGLRPGETLAGRFVVIREIGRGGSGLVVEAHDLELDQAVALKLLWPHLDTPEGRERLRREVRACRGAPPELVQVYDLHEHRGRPFLSMELVRGESLAQRLQREGPLAVAEVVTLGRDVARALAHLHRRGLVHRDVKPGNVLLLPGGGARLCDAGLARPEERGVTVTQTRMVVGTPAYMAPEQGLPGGGAAAADVYALGLTLYAALTGEPPLDEGSALATLLRRRRERPPPVRRRRPDVPRWLGRLLARMTEPRPSDRPTAREVARALERGAYRPRPRRRTVVAAAAAVALAAAAWAVLPALLGRRPERVEVTGREILGVDRRGEVRWRIPLPGERWSVTRGDLDGSGRAEWVVASWSERAPAGGPPPARLVAVTVSGRRLEDVELGDLIERWPFPYPRWLRPSPLCADLDGDGVDEVVVEAHHPLYYPQVLLVRWSRDREWRQLLAHSGRIFALAPLPPAAGRPGRLAFLAMNNRLGMLVWYGEIEVPWQPPPGGEPLAAGDEPVEPAAESPARWLAYVPLGEAVRRRQRPDRLRLRPDGSLAVTGLPGVTGLDAWRNPVPGPNAGRDLRAARLRLAAGISRLRFEAWGRSPAAVREEMGRLRDGAGPMLAEPPYRAVLAEQGARALARAGDLEGALGLIGPAARELATDELRYREAHLLAVAGSLEAAWRRVLELLDDPHTDRGTFDAAELAVRIAIGRHDRDGLEEALRRLWAATDVARRGAATAPAVRRARAHLWWDEVDPADLEVRSGPYSPAGDAVAILCRWRAGRTRPGDLERARELARASVEGVWEARLAAAAAALAGGRPREAAGIAAWLPALEREAADDYGALQLLELGLALHAAALRQAGEEAAARRAAAAALPRLTPGLLPWRLVREVAGAARGGYPRGQRSGR